MRFRLFLAAAVLILAGCGMGGCTSLGRAAVGPLPDYEVRKKPNVTCSALVDRVNRAESGAELTGKQLLELYRACEEMQAGTLVKPEAVRGAVSALSP